jgi:hypothetical protein
MISTRYLVPLCALLALALVPTVIHSYMDDVERDGRSTVTIPDRLAGYAGAPSDRNATWGERRFGADDWIERTYVTAGDEVRLTVVRSFDPKALYHHPELAVAYGTSFVGLETRRFAARPEVPVFVLEPGPGVAARAMYVLHYGDEFVEAPIRFQLRTAGALLFSTRKPMTLFFVLDPAAPPDGDIETSGATRLLFSAIDGFLEPES